MDMENKDQLICFFLSGKISLSQYDYKFMSNLLSLAKNRNRVTTNQAGLFSKLIGKYARQLAKQGLNSNELSALPWKTEVVESTEEYTGAKVMIEDDEVILRVPFNKAFISAFKDFPHNPFVWSKESRVYRAPWSTNAFKIAATKLHKYFRTVKFCENSTELLNELKQYDSVKFWNPTLTIVNGQLVVAAMNSSLADVIKDVPLTLEPKELYQLVQYGITIDPELTQNDPLLQFASEKVYTAEVTNLPWVATSLNAIGCNKVSWGRGLMYSSLGKELQKEMTSLGFESVSSNQPLNPNECVPWLTLRPTGIPDARQAPTGTGKVIMFTDSRPIDTKK